MISHDKIASYYVGIAYGLRVDLEFGLIIAPVPQPQVKPAKLSQKQD